jgi:cytochrome P450
LVDLLLDRYTRFRRLEIKIFYYEILLGTYISSNRALTDLATLFKYPWTQLNFFAHARTRKNVKFIKEQIIRGINERRKQHQESSERKNDILDILLTVNEKTGESEFTDEDIVDHMNTFL